MFCGHKVEGPPVFNNDFSDNRLALPAHINGHLIHRTEHQVTPALFFRYFGHMHRRLRARTRYWWRECVVDPLFLTATPSLEW